jgi:vacuolar-type H+-ATPase subunit F/Vma7
MSAGLSVICPEELAAGFRLAGVRASSPESRDALARLLGELADREAELVLAVHAPYLDDLPAGLRHRLDEVARPLVIALPSGEPAEAEDRRARLLRLLQRAVGVQFTFDTEETP